MHPSLSTCVKNMEVTTKASSLTCLDAEDHTAKWLHVAIVCCNLLLCCSFIYRMILYAHNAHLDTRDYGRQRRSCKHMPAMINGLARYLYDTQTQPSIVPWLARSLVTQFVVGRYSRQLSIRWWKAQCSAFTFCLWPWQSTAQLQHRRTPSALTIIWLMDFLMLFSRRHASAVWIENIILIQYPRIYDVYIIFMT